MTKQSSALFTAALLCGAALTAACASSADESSRPPAGTVENPVETSTSQGITCTPGARSCDFACGYGGGYSSDDCIVQCNAAGNGYVTVDNCGWAQNFPYSSSCLDVPPNNAICKWN